MNKILIGVGILLIILSLTLPANSAQSKEYWIDGNRELLVFVGDPVTTRTVVGKLTTFGTQRIKLMHKKSGYGLYAFHLKGLEVKNDRGQMIVVDTHGFFIAKKSWIRSSEYKIKTSLKHKTKEQ